MSKMARNVNIGLYGAFFYRISLFFFANRDLFRLRNMPTNFRDVGLSGYKVMSKMARNVNIALYGAFFFGFLYFFFANCDLFRLRNMPTRFRDAAPSGYKVMSKLARNVNIGLYGGFFFGFLYSFFANCDLFRLRNMPTNFRDVGLSGYKVMSKMARNVNIALYGAFFFGFLYSFLLTVIYLSYETCLRGFATQRPVDIKLCQNWLELSVLDYMVSFLSDFLIFFFVNCDLFRLRNMSTKFRDAAPSGYKVMSKMARNVSIGLYGALFFGFLYSFFANCDLFRLRNMPTNFRDVGLSGYKVMSKMARNVNIALYGAFFFGFLYSFLLTVISLGYEICLRIFATLGSVDIKLCQKWLEMSILHYMVRFFSDFFILFC
jgi:hypothetical protein